MTTCPPLKWDPDLRRSKRVRHGDVTPLKPDVQRLLAGVVDVLSSLGDYLDRDLDALDEEMVDAGVPLTPAAVERRRERVAAGLAAPLPRHLVVLDVNKLGRSQGVRQAEGPHEAAHDSAGMRSAKTETRRPPGAGETPAFLGPIWTFTTVPAPPRSLESRHV